MNNTKSPVSCEENFTPYSHNGGSLSLSRPALVELCRHILNNGQPFRFCAQGPSMSPFIRNGDIITLAPCHPVSCRLGNVVAFIQPGTERLIVHRVVSISKNGCRIRGDNTLEDDGEIPHTSIIGKVIRVERDGNVIRFGLGPERVIIALLSRWRWLPYCIGAAGAVCSMIRRFS